MHEEGTESMQKKEQNLRYLMTDFLSIAMSDAKLFLQHVHDLDKAVHSN